MIPTNTGKTNPCDPISSNCVIWQGPDIPCINICNGDTISDVTAKIGEELCDLVAGTCLCDPDMSTIDLSCIGTGSAGTIQEVTQQIIDYLCALTPGSSGETICDLPECLWYFDNDGVTLIKQDTICNYVFYLGGKICHLIDLHNILSQTVSSNSQAIQLLQDAQHPEYVPPTLVPQCKQLINAIGTTSPVQLDILLQGLQLEFCDLIEGLGIHSDMSNAISSNICALTGSLITNQPVGGTNNYGSLQNWINPVGNFSQSFNNMWVAFCDLKSALQDVQANCCTVGCENIVYDFDVYVVDPGTGVTGINFLFNGSSIPAPFADCAGGSKITATDAFGVSTSAMVPVFSLQNDLVGFFLPIGALNTLSTYTCTVEFCFNDGTYQCEYQYSKDITFDFSCPPGYGETHTDTTVSYSFANGLGNDVIYKVAAINTITGLVDSSNAHYPPAPITISGTLINLSPGTEYYLQITIINASLPTIETVCPLTSFITDPTTCTSVFEAQGVDYVETIGAGGPYVMELGRFDNAVTGDLYIWSMGSDPITGEPKILQDIQPTSGVSSFTINGTSVGSNTVTCEGAPHSGAPPGTAYMVGSFTAANAVDYYIYGFWGPDPFGLGMEFCAQALICCECPTQLLDQHWDGETATPFLFTPSIPFGVVTGAAIITYPVNGTIINHGNGTFTYTHSGPGQTDSFEVTIQTACGTSNVATMTVEIVTIEPILDDDTDIYIFIDTGSFTIPEATIIKQQIDDFVVDILADCAASYNGHVFILCTAHNAWLDYVKCIADAGVSTATMTPTFGYPNIWPSTWPTPGPNAPTDPNKALVLAFCSESVGTYHSANVFPDIYAGATAQPSLAYSLGYDEFLDGLYGDGHAPYVPLTVWGIALTGGPGWAGFDKFSAILIPQTLAGLGATKAANLMNYAALECRKVPNQEFIGKQMTDPGNIAPYIDESLYAGVMPYDGFATPAQAGTPGGNTLEGLKERGWLVYLNQLGPGYDFTNLLTPMVYLGATHDDCPDVP